MNKWYGEQAKLLLDLLPYVLADERFALKGGTAINMFYRDIPRISVDIDLTYLPIEPRNDTLAAIDGILKSVSTQIKRYRPQSKIVTKRLKNGNGIALAIEENGVSVKIEPNTIIRGSVYPAVMRQHSKAAAEVIGYDGFIEVQVLSSADLYGGKICAALDRQHPRDLFDILILFENEGLTSEIRKAFIIYLCGHDRPMSEQLSPTRLEMQDVFEKEFTGMTERPVTWSSLSEVREKLITTINRELTGSEREFLLSMKQGEPNWELLELPGVEMLPSLQWKLLNIRKMDGNKRSEMVDKLKKILKY